MMGEGVPKTQSVVRKLRMEKTMKIRGRLLVAVLLGSVFSVALYAAILTGHTQLHPIDQSGIQAEVHLADTGTSLKALGVASGLNPRHAYISLIYGAGSVPGGPRGWEPDWTMKGPQMVLGFWAVEPDGSGTLVVSGKTGPAYAPVTNAGTVSIRDANLGFALQACGQVAVNTF